MEELVYRDVTLEVLKTFEVDKSLVGLHSLELYNVISLASPSA